MKLSVAILAGGLATRLHPLTETIPKALVEVAGKPFILRQLDYLRRQGVSRAVLCVGFLGEQIEAVVGDGSNSGLTVSYSQDWPMLMGTGGALRQALPLLDSQFLVLYGDSYLPVDFSAVERAFFASGKPALMTVQRNEDRWDKSNVLFRGGAILEYNKSAPKPDMQYIDYGLGAISAQILQDEKTTGPFDLADVYNRLSLSGRLAGYEVHERFYEIGSHKGLAEAADYFRGRGE
ncbi:nucleotidyltransferase family protein [Bradyrhizobium erythrophlei]|uniref:Nucleotidyl transferase n=1 Tax=Bradyrhizobium erythrophlei TaxID=1437360 RepID=A0A1M5UP82_9BRAD|nr:nucleotidyltransferase family protein [Bradyrhizobium erythrophlei]SHH64716.1 Nucleotidyl transferase [Bradyrhizobium erythrophlei]